MRNAELALPTHQSLEIKIAYNICDILSVMVCYASFGYGVLGSALTWVDTGHSSFLSHHKQLGVGERKAGVLMLLDFDGVVAAEHPHPAHLALLNLRGNEARDIGMML